MLPRISNENGTSKQMKMNKVYTFARNMHLAFRSLAAILL